MAGVVPGIITNGLGGSAHNMICGFFHLGPIEIIIPGSPPIGSPPIGSPPLGSPPVIPPVIQPPGGGGGSVHPRPFWPDQTKEWDDDHPRTIIIRITHKKKVTEKMYVVSSKRAKFVIKVLNFVSKTRDMISIKVSNVKSKFAKIIVKFKGNKE